MKKFISNFTLFVIITLILLIIVLSTVGIETNRLNNIISKKINQTNSDINLELTTIRFKLDIKEISLFLETIDPQIDYREITIPAEHIKVYIDFLSLIKSDPKIEKITLIINQLDIKQLKKISTTFKPSNFTSIINNKIKQGRINTELEVYLDNNNLFENFIARGSVTDLKTEIKKNINLNKINFSFFADKNDILLKNIYGETDSIQIKDGDLKLKLSPEITLESNFTTNIKYKNQSTNNSDLLKNFEYAKNIVILNANLNNSFSINLDKTYKVKKYDYKSKGKIINVNLDFKKSLADNFLKGKINQLSLKNSKISVL